MTKRNARSFPQLREVFMGYLHEDFLEDYDTASGALRAFYGEASARERQRFRDEARQFLERTAHLDFEEVQALMERLGCRWLPSSRDELTTVLEGSLPSE